MRIRKLMPVVLAIVGFSAYAATAADVRIGQPTVEPAAAGVNVAAPAVGVHVNEAPAAPGVDVRTGTPAPNTTFATPPNAALATPNNADVRNQGQPVAGDNRPAMENRAVEANVISDNRVDPWRYKWTNNRWWYWTPENRWMVYSDPGGWTYYESSGDYTTGYGGAAVVPSTTYVAPSATYYPSTGYYYPGYYYGRPGVGVYIGRGWNGYYGAWGRRGRW